MTLNVIKNDLFFCIKFPMPKIPSTCRYNTIAVGWFRNKENPKEKKHMPINN